MCGIAGLWNADDPRALDASIRAMTAALARRGPDGEGTWIDPAAGLALGHRRLSILDLSAAGAQPMISFGGRYAITYNGEVYNFRALRKELALEGLQGFRGHSDTEVMLAAIEQWGVREAAERFVGMFAFAVWDRERRELHLVRDRLGIKPLYYGRAGRALAFASDLASFEALDGFDAEVDPEACVLYFRYGCVPGEHAIYRGVEKQRPGTILTFTARDREPRETVFWSAADVARRGLADPLPARDEREAIDRLEDQLRTAVRDRLVADVPLGAFLSGGIDSSTVAALMQLESGGTPVRTFSIGFEDPAYDEATDAARVAAHLGTDHTELTVTPREAMDAIPELAAVYTEPFADSSQLPTLLVSRLARRHVTVALSGDGGDELFAGYNRHVWASRLWWSMRVVPAPLRHLAARALESRPPADWDDLAASGARVLPLLRLRTPGDKAHKLAGLLDATDFDQLYLALTSLWREPERVVARRTSGSAALRFAERLPHATPAAEMMFRDLVSYLPDDILTKVDRASMSVGLEARVPLLDHRVVALAWRLPLSLKLRGGESKWILRRVLERHVPRALFDRPKMGFGVPVGDWVRGPLRDWAESLLDERAMREDGLLDVDTVRASWQRHLEGTGVEQHRVWTVLMFQAWRRRRGALSPRAADASAGARREPISV